MFENSIVVLDWLGIVAFTITGALIAARNQMDIIGFVLLGTVTGIGGGTIRDVILDLHPVLWVAKPEYLAVCIGVSVLVYFTVHLAHSHMRLLLWVDAAGMALYATVGAERALSIDASPLVAVVMGVITATFGGIIRDLLAQTKSIIFTRELYVTAAMGAAVAYVVLQQLDCPRELAVVVGVAVGFGLRAGAMLRGWSLPHHQSDQTTQGP